MADKWIMVAACLAALPAQAQTTTPPQRSMQQLLDEVGIAGEEMPAPKPAPVARPERKVTLDENGLVRAAKTIEAQQIQVSKRTTLNYGLYTIDMKDGVVVVSPLLPREGTAPTAVPAMSAIIVQGTPRPPGYTNVVEISTPATLNLMGTAELFPFPKNAPALSREVDRSKEAMPQYNNGENPNVSQRNRNMTRALDRAERAVPQPNQNLPRNWQSVK